MVIILFLTKNDPAGTLKQGEHGIRGREAPYFNVREAGGVVKIYKGGGRHVS